jgi:Mg/Co/Ni transporter MgtE
LCYVATGRIDVVYAGVAGEVVQFLWTRKRWWLIPLVVALLMFACVMVFATASGVAPFIYTLF